MSKRSCPGLGAMRNSSEEDAEGQRGARKHSKRPAEALTGSLPGEEDEESDSGSDRRAAQCSLRLAQLQQLALEEEERAQRDHLRYEQERMQRARLLQELQELAAMQQADLVQQLHELAQHIQNSQLPAQQRQEQLAQVARVLRALGE
ncbi:hypothetical protein COHA_009660 [Chlorella ohadii]|uniref:Uncharacterized protein n=1 Tax=Chlorella ohadii TaxID=2649997 RepID=A0AAD5DHK0_9CHLO|nr:hypothetical protein COHA_009660 [Chlorella ohadii]